MLDITVKQTRSTGLYLHSAILLYGRNGETHYGAHHAVRLSQQGPVIGPGTSLSGDLLREAVKQLATGAVSDCFLDANVLAASDGFLAWWRAPQKTLVWFDSANLFDFYGDEARKRAFSTTLPIPGLVFVVDHGEFFVYAVEGEQRPTRDSILYHAPLMNVWESGEICTGNVKLPKEASSHRIKDWERAFFGSKSTHFNPRENLNYPGDYLGLTRDLIEGNIATTPQGVLKPFKGTLKAKLNSFTTAKKKGRRDD
jgi:PRTRC genetic system protein B